MNMKIGCAELASALFEAIKSAPELTADTHMHAGMLVHETAARDAILNWCEGKSSFGHLPPDVRSLAAAFMSDFLLKVSSRHPDLAQRMWLVPMGLSPVEQAKHAVAQELRSNSDPAPRKH